MNLKNGFYSNNIAINPDSRMLNNRTIESNDMYLAECFLHGDQVDDPVYVHQVVKVIYSSGRLKYPTLWNKAKKYVQGYEYDVLEKILVEHKTTLSNVG